ncbi:MAG: hypothetical protein ACRC1K_20090, partial [Planctomycetia bacterium]
MSQNSATTAAEDWVQRTELFFEDAERNDRSIVPAAAAELAVEGFRLRTALDAPSRDDPAVLVVWKQMVRRLQRLYDLFVKSSEHVSGSGEAARFDATAAALLADVENTMIAVGAEPEQDPALRAFRLEALRPVLGFVGGVVDRLENLPAPVGARGVATDLEKTKQAIDDLTVAAPGEPGLKSLTADASAARVGLYAQAACVEAATPIDPNASAEALWRRRLAATTLLSTARQSLSVAKEHAP